jgi:hypothetical protein
MSSKHTKKSTPWFIYHRRVETPQCIHHRGVKTPWHIHHRGVETSLCIHHQGVIFDTEESFTDFKMQITIFKGNIILKMDCRLL